MATPSLAVSGFSEFQAVILAGGNGRKLYPLVEFGNVKPMIPVCNRPLISYQIELLEKSGFTEVIVLTTGTTHDRVAEYISSREGPLKPTVVCTNSYESADSLAEIAHLIHGNFFVISCDTILDGTTLQNMADVHRTTDAGVTVLLHPLSPDEMTASSKAKSEKRDLVALDSRVLREGSRSVAGADRSHSSSTSGASFYSSSSTDRSQQLLYFHPADSAETTKFRLKRSLLTRHPDLTVHYDMLDGHVYIFSKWALDLIPDLPDTKSIQRSLIPYMIQHQFQQTEGSEASQSAKDFALIDDYNSSNFSNIRRNRCFAYVSDVYCKRCNNLRLFLEVNRDISKGNMKYKPSGKQEAKGHYVGEHVEISPKTAMATGSVIGSNTKIGDKCSIKSSVVGINCQIGNDVKIANSVLMDGCIVHENTIIQNSIVCSGVVINEGCTVKDCTIGYSMQVASKAVVKEGILAE